MANRIVEVFVTGCPLCDHTVKLVKEVMGHHCDVTVWDLREDHITDEGRTKLTQYGIHRVPAVVIDGALAECCQIQQPISRETLIAAGLSAS